MRRSRLVLLLTMVFGVLPVSSDAASTGSTVLRIDAAAVTGRLNHDLVGFDWHEGGAPLSSVAPLHPKFVRIDASLQDVSVDPQAPLVLGPVLDRITAVRALGSEPLVILSYMPAWLGQPRAFGRDPTRVPPSDLDVWEDLVHDVVYALATAPAAASYFEAWNEPDIPLFWQDTPGSWVDTVERSARAVARVEQETGLDLAFGGPATAFPDPLYLTPFVARLRDTALPLDFVSWHYYGNDPFFGPDGAEFAVTEPVQPVIGQRNPIASPAAYGLQVEFMRDLTHAGLAGSGRPLPALVLDEWNLSAGGFDLRHDSAEGAAFTAGTLIEMQDASLDASAFFMATDTRGVPGEHGTVRTDGSRKPVWWAFDLWQQLAPTQVAMTGVPDRLSGLWGIATVDHNRVVVLLASFTARPGSGADHAVTLRIDGVPGPIVSASLRSIDSTHSAADTPEPLAVDGATVTVELRTPAIALVELALS